MNEPIQFSVQSLLSQRKGVIHGAMFPLLFAKEIAEAVGFKYNRVARVWFKDERFNQHWEDGGLTGHDTLIIGMQYANDLWLSLWVDAGVGGVPVAMALQSDGLVDVTGAYRETTYARNLTDGEIKEIFDSIFANPALINIKSDEIASLSDPAPADESNQS